MQKAGEALASAKREFNASLIRNRSDYEDFYVCSITDTEELVAGADSFCTVIKAYLEARYPMEA